MMNLKFWKNPTTNRLLEAETDAFAKIDDRLGKDATDEDFLRVLATLAAHWCVTQIDGETLSREQALRRAGMFYRLVNDRVYADTNEPDTSEIRFLP
jgi:hypothetical protein